MLRKFIYRHDDPYDDYHVTKKLAYEKRIEFLV